MSAVPQKRPSLPGARSLAPDDPRRTHPRSDVEIEVSMESDSNFYLGLTENLSEGGLFIATMKIRPIGARVEISFKLPNAPAGIRAVGTVRWTRDYSENIDSPAGIGVRFEQIGDRDVQHIRDFLAQRTPLFYDD